MFRCVNARMWNLSRHVIVYISVDWDCFRTVWYFWLDCHYSGDPKSFHGHIAIRVSFMKVHLDLCPPMHMYRCVDARICIPGGHIHTMCRLVLCGQSKWMTSTWDFWLYYKTCDVHTHVPVTVNYYNLLTNQRSRRNTFAKVAFHNNCKLPTAAISKKARVVLFFKDRQSIWILVDPWRLQTKWKPILFSLSSIPWQLNIATGFITFGHLQARKLWPNNLLRLDIKLFNYLW